ncbi:MAG: Hpt domain-containing protein [Pseudomonadota bacterium]
MADQYVAEDLDGVTESLFGSGNMAYASLQASQSDAALFEQDSILINDDGNITLGNTPLIKPTNDYATTEAEKYQQEQNQKTIFNWKQLNEFTDGAKDIEIELIDMFIDNLKVDITALQNALHKEDFKSWDSVVHNIYGACSHIGATELASFCEEGQDLLQNNTQKIPI